MKDFLEKSFEYIEQTKKRIRKEKVKPEDRIVSLHDTDARPIIRGKKKKEVEFGYKVRITTESKGFVTEYEVYKPIR